MQIDYYVAWKEASRLKTQQFTQLHIKPWSVSMSNMLPLYGAHSLKIEIVRRRTVRWVNSNYSTYASVSSMLNSLGWLSLEDRRADARPILFYKIVYSLVVVSLPQHINHSIRMTRHIQSCTLFTLSRYQLKPVTTKKKKKKKTFVAT